MDSSFILDDRYNNDLVTLSWSEKEVLSEFLEKYLYHMFEEKVCHSERNTPAPWAWRMSWRCGLGTQVVFFVASHAVFLSSFFRFVVLVTIYLYDSL